MKYKPLRDAVILKEIYYPEKPDSPFIVERKKHERIGEVVSIGKGYKRNGVNSTAEFKVGDKVVWDNKFGVQRIEEGKDTYIICNSFAYILAKIV